MMNMKTEPKSPRPPPILNLSFRTPRKNQLPLTPAPISPPRVQSQRNQKQPAANNSNGKSLLPLTARPKPPDPVFSQTESATTLNDRKNPRFHFFIPQTYQRKNLPLRISPIIPDAPISPEEAIDKYFSLLTPFEVTEILEFPEVFFVGFKNKKSDVNLSDSKSFGFDDPNNGFYRASIGDHIIYRFEIQSLIGQGRHGQIYKCFDHKLKQNIAIKMLANNKRSPTQSKVEMTILSRLKKLHPDNIETAQIYFVFRQHMFVTFNILSKNLNQLMKLNSINTLSPRLVRCVAQDVVKQLKEMSEIGVTLHGQILGENILLVPNTNAEFKLIDFSNSILDDNFPEDYEIEVPLSYRPPEVIFGMSFSHPFDMWCLGCLLVHLTTGSSLFEAKDDINQLAIFTELLGNPDPEMMKKIPQSRKLEFFDKSTGTLNKNLIENPKKEGSMNLKSVLTTNDAPFVDFLMKIFTWDQAKRITIDEALQHPYITDIESRLPELIKEK